MPGLVPAPGFVEISPSTGLSNSARFAARPIVAREPALPLRVRSSINQKRAPRNAR